MLDFFGIRNFKGLVKADIELKPITILIGANGSGKSSIAQALLLIKQIEIDNKIKVNGPYINLGEKEDIYSNRDTAVPIKFTFRGKRDNAIYDYEVEIENHVISAKKGKLKSDFFSLTSTLSSVNPSVYQGKGFTLNLAPSNRILRIFEQSGSSTTSYDPKELETARTKLYTLSSALRRDFPEFWLIPAVRGTLNPFEPLQDTPRSNLAIPSQEGLNERNANWVSTLAYQPHVLETVSSWCNEILGTPLKDRLAPQKRITLERTREITDKKRDQRPNISLVNEGFGLNQLAFLLTQLALASPDSTVIIEEPEIHLHPRAQSKLMEILIKEALDRRKRLLITTHSEHIIYHALTKLGLGELKQDELALYHFEERKDGCHGKKLEVDEKGRLKEGLPDFFEANIEQYKRYIDVLIGTEAEERNNDREILHT